MWQTLSPYRLSKMSDYIFFFCHEYKVTVNPELLFFLSPYSLRKLTEITNKIKNNIKQQFHLCKIQYVVGKMHIILSFACEQDPISSFSVSISGTATFNIIVRLIYFFKRDRITTVFLLFWFDSAASIKKKCQSCYIEEEYSRWHDLLLGKIEGMQFVKTPWDKM